ncbi:7-cyano-7-deazaguanine synthase QueC [Methanosalsum natronophilum]|uniref:7-cyano-7-deazaguanine synthase n=1 Tax=Methanosalsum natronophilum TaxID=768733 RepID=A0A3R7XJ53_9EURY|nr:7-cyano-7-deazaguanine synthase QueC [Methanosalsum natronophilum]MCS3923176.1 7-cyano-7-deazaguanine synthase [Methanosalsum natronophilum]RQD90969.1 MAG: 7-cyano-7-deazaguanine synthase QueC [Methanosalsum natronophilum]
MKSISLLSGGLDSIVATSVAMNEGININLAIVFDYGQRAAKKEIGVSKRFCEHMSIPYDIIKLDWLESITKTSLVNKDKSIPHLSQEEINEDDMDIVTESARQVWVPNRNGVMINIAASFAESMGCDYIIVGFNEEEASTFPDNSESFMKSVNLSLSYSTQKSVEVYAPLLSYDKEAIVRKGVDVKAPLEFSWSCYYGDDKPCGVCESCVRRKIAFEEVGMEDPCLR